MKTRFYLCTVCGNVVLKAVDSGVDMSCCGKEMVELIPSETEGMGEKHLPVVEFKKDDMVKVKIGSVAHPMTVEHHIVFIYLETEHGGQLRYLEPGKPAEAVFCLGKCRLVAVYAYCNIHGFWKTEVDSEPARSCFIKCCK